MSVLLVGSSHKPKIGVIVGVVGGLFVLLPCSMLVFLYKGRRKGYKREVFVDVAGLYCIADQFFWYAHNHELVVGTYIPALSKLILREIIFCTLKFLL